MAVADIRYVRLGYVALNVSDLARSADFYETIVGLERVPASSPDMALFRCSDRHQDIVLYEGPPGLKRVAWQMESEAALSAVRAEFASLGIDVVEVGAADLAGLGIAHAVRAIEPTTGTQFEFFTEIEGVEPYRIRHTKIAQLGHVVVTTPQREDTEMFMIEHLNFRVSDRVEGVVAFMRCFPNPFHHSFGVGQAQGDEPMLQHVNFMVTEIDDIGRALNRLKRHNVPIVFGPGRHPTSESVFLYFLDPDGLTLEYSFGMEEFPEEGDRAPRGFPRALESLDTWGGRAERDFGKVGHIERPARAGEA
ncbi:VOC family protein [Sphingomonas naphthae]|uniref:VOC family protein n=1 Tax=Sphingomonas naphthae TaxID=1813468 RepID=A0ABY7TG11_9SPHN|nr:VOC family protein [Sphingomonas naphthae]WCT72166.1 VOC family protein [Sphingomonas naphthae]